MNKYAKIVLSIIVCTALAACAAEKIVFTKNWGKIVPDNEATEVFETYKVSPDFNYYISGSDVYPNAILGLNKAYTLDSTLWKKVELSQANLQEMVTDMKSKARDIGQNQFGFVVLDNQGKKIGVWYSLLTATAPVRMKEDNKVIIYTPDQNTYEKYEGNSPLHNVPMR
ncbi:MAG: hypothetical protein ABFD57_09330 [Smithella sp.]|nr:hypothetical protein [Syntrophaceae bacterium]NTW77816.1 hypothetical protein [Syntrophaceae bacterium]